jgi:hypothetical protein
VVLTLFLTSAALASVQPAEGEKKKGAIVEKPEVKIPAEVVSEKVVDEYTVDGIKVTKIIQRVRIKKSDVLAITPPEDRDRLKDLPDIIEYEVTVVKEGSQSITYGNALYSVYACITLNIPKDPSDPVNLRFSQRGSAFDVQYDMKNWLTNLWRDTSIGCNLMAYIDNTEHGGSAYWKVQDYQLEYDSWYTSRYHIRIFGGGFDTHGFFGEWSIAGVHLERWDPLAGTHVIVSWESAEQFVRDDFTGKWFVGSVYLIFIYNDGLWQGVWNDGYATAIELKS